MKKDDSMWTMVMVAFIIPIMIGLVILIQAFPIPFPHIIKPNANPHLFIFFIVVLPILVAFTILIWLQIRDLKDEFRYRQRGT